MGAPTCSRQETPAWAFPISTIPIPTTILSPSTVPPRSARRLARRIKSAVGGIWANKPIQAAELMGAPTCSRQETPAWAFPISTIPIPTTILSPSTVPPRSARRLARRVKSAAGGIWANKPIQAAELNGAGFCAELIIQASGTICHLTALLRSNAIASRVHSSSNLLFDGIGLKGRLWHI